MSNNNRKEFKTIEEQIQYLNESKNIVINPKIKTMLEQRPYVSVINPYKKLFAKGYGDNRHVYNENIEFDKYLDLIALDDQFSKLLFERIGTFERIFKRQIAYKISMKMYENGDLEGTSYVKHIEDYFNGDVNALNKIGFIEIDQRYDYSGRIT